MVESNGMAQRDAWRAAARAAAGSGDLATAGTYYDRLLPLLSAPEQVEILLDWGAAQEHAGQWREAEARYRQALTVAERDLDRAAQARSGATLGRLLESTGAFDQALTILAAARDDFAALDDQANLQQTLGRMARAYISQGDYAAARDCCERKLEIADSLHLPREVAQARYQMGTIYMRQGAYEEALACFEQSLRQAIAEDNRADEALIKDHMGLIYTIQGQYPQALACYAAALDTAAALGKQRNVSHIAAHIGQIYLQHGEFARAHACFVFLLDTALALGDRPGVSVALALLGDTAMHQEHDTEAERLAQAALALGRRMSLSYVPGYLCALAELDLRQGRPAEAQPRLAEALRLATASGHQAFAFEAQVLDLRARFARGQMDAGAARAALEALLANAADEREQAVVHYEIWRLDPARDAHRDAALALYREMYRETPEIDERRRIEELTGAPLPAPPTLPDLPAIVQRQPARLADLLAQVDQLLAAPA
jgi:tetratricopeptide (TPR) repeat protein